MKLILVVLTLVASLLSAQISCAAQADLSVTAVQFSPDPIYVNDWITTTVTVTNASDIDYTNQFFVNIQGTTVQVDSLGAGATTNVTVTNAYSFGTPGTATSAFGIQADDEDQSNNWISSSITAIVDPNKPFVWITSLNSEEHLVAGQTYKIDMQTNMLPVGSSIVLSLLYSDAGECPGGCKGYEDPIGTYAGGQFTWTVPTKYASSAIAYGQFQIHAKVIGSPGAPHTHLVEDYNDAFFAIDPQPFTLSILPTNGTSTPEYQLTGMARYNYEIQASTNLVDWTTITTLFNTNGIVTFSDPDSTNNPSRFYRGIGLY